MMLSPLIIAEFPLFVLDLTIYDFKYTQLWFFRKNNLLLASVSLAEF